MSELLQTKLIALALGFALGAITVIIIWLKCRIIDLHNRTLTTGGSANGKS